MKQENMTLLSETEEWPQGGVTARFYCNMTTQAENVSRIRLNWYDMWYMICDIWSDIEL